MPHHTTHIMLIAKNKETIIGLLHPTGANDVLSYPLFVRDFFLSFFLSKETISDVAVIGNRGDAYCWGTQFLMVLLCRHYQLSMIANKV